MAELRTMYPPQKDSPSTFLLGDISATDVLMTVANAALLPQTFPYPLTVGIDRSITETVMVTACNLENNQLTIVRGPNAISWTAGVKAGRVLRAQDVEDIQENIKTIADESEQVAGLIPELEATIADNTEAIGSTKVDLNTESARAKKAESDEVTRAVGEEERIDAAKPERSELVQVITGCECNAANDEVTLEFTRYNSVTKQVSTFAKTLPIVTGQSAGLMSVGMYDIIGDLRDDVETLINEGGKFIGVSFATYAALMAYTVPASVKVGDYTYVIDDETRDGAVTRYVWTLAPMISQNPAWQFTFIVEQDPIAIANATTAGIVKSDSGSTNGKVLVGVDGMMSVIGWGDLNTEVDNLGTAITGLRTDLGTAEDEIIANTNRIKNFTSAVINPTIVGSDITIPANRIPSADGGIVSFILDIGIGEATDVSINGKDLYSDNINYITPNLMPGKMYTVYFSQEEDAFFLQTLEGEKDSKITLRITFDPKITVGTRFSVVGGSLNYVGVVPSNRMADVSANDINTTYVVTCSTTSNNIVVENLYGVFETYIQRWFINGFDITLGTSDPSARVQYPSDVDNYGYTPAKMNFGGAFSYGSWSPNDWFMPKPCMLRSDGTVAYFLNPNNYAQKADGSASDVVNTSFDGNAMMQWPKIFMKRTEVNGIYSFRISNFKVNDDYECWCNYDIDDNEIPFFYTPIYFGSGSTSKMRSLSGQSNFVSYTAQQEVAAAKANGERIWYTEVLSDRMLFIDLCTLIGKSTNGQAVFGQGRVNSSATLNTGSMDTKGLFWGGNPDETGVKVFGMEHPWGNIYRRTAGYLYSSGVQFVKITRGRKDGSTISDYDFTTTGYISIEASTFGGSSGGYISGTLTHQYGRFAKTLSGSATTYDCDAVFFSTGPGPYYALFGGYWDYALRAGPSCVDLDDAASGTGSGRGAALSCKPLA